MLYFLSVRFFCSVLNLGILNFVFSVSSGMVKNPDSARVSIPSLLIQRSDGTYHWRMNLTKTAPFWEGILLFEFKLKVNNNFTFTKYLSKSICFLSKGWFKNLSELFLTSKVTKLLILAGTDRLDKTLTIGQMQGKFQLVVLPSVGHTIQEDVHNNLPLCCESHKKTVYSQNSTFLNSECCVGPSRDCTDSLHFLATFSSSTTTQKTVHFMIS